MSQSACPNHDRWVALAIFVLTSSVYFATLSGVTSSNDGSHYALVRAIVDRGSFEITPYLSFTEHQDYALRGDLRFSDRPPGTALVASPLYALGHLAPPPLQQLPSKHDPDNPLLLYAVLAAPLAAAGAVSLFYLTLRRHLGCAQSGALFATLALAFGTTNWKYGSVLYSHALGALVVSLSLYLVFALESQTKRQWLLALALGFVLGFSPLVEYTNLPFAAVMGLYALPGFRERHADRDGEVSEIWWWGLITALIGGLIPIAFLLVYNTVNFGGPFELSTFNVDTVRWPQNEGMAADFATPLSVGLPAMLFFGQENQGLFLLSPVALIGLIGAIDLIRFSRKRSALVLGLFVMMLLIFSKSTTFNAATNDGRYLTPFLGLWFTAVAFAIDRYYLKSSGELSRLLLIFVAMGLLMMSIRNQIVHIALSWNYDLDFAHFERLAVGPPNIFYLLHTLFPNAANLPILWVGELLVIGAIGVVQRWRERHAQQLTPASAPSITK